MIRERDILIHPEQTLLDALVLLNTTRKKHLIVVDAQDTLRGVLTDGDIRRVLIDRADLGIAVSEAMNRNPIVVNEQIRPQDIQKIISDRMSIIPVVDKDKKYLGYYSAHQEVFKDTIRDRSISIFGMGYVGLTLGLVLADCGFRVYGYDVNQKLIGQLRQGTCPFHEKGMQKYLSQHGNKAIKFTSDLRGARADVYVIAVGTPLRKGSRSPDIGHFESALVSVGRIMQPGSLVILRSTVPVCTSRRHAIPVLERESGAVCGKDFLLSFAPERTAEGQALRELRFNPQIIGAYDANAYRLTSALFNTFTSTIIDVGSLEAAELCKLIDNTFRDHLFAYANNLVPLAEHLGLNISELIEAVNLGYTRNFVPKPSPGVGGPCLSKDPYILGMAFQEAGLSDSLLLNVRTVNESGPGFLMGKLRRLLSQAGKTIEDCGKICLVGLAFKGEPETSDLRDSTSLWFLDLFQDKRNIYAYDPVVGDQDIRNLGITPVDLENLFTDADAVVILNNHKEYETWNLGQCLEEMNKPAVFLDAWNIFPSLYFKRHPGILYGGLGNG